MIPEANTWQKVRPPVKPDAPSRKLKEIRFVGRDQLAFYIDDIRVVREEVLVIGIEEEMVAVPTGYRLESGVFPSEEYTYFIWFLQLQKLLLNDPSPTCRSRVPTAKPPSHLPIADRSRLLQRSLDVTRKSRGLFQCSSDF